MTKSPQDDEDDENYNPFATLFGRISASAKDEQKTDGGSGSGNGDTDTVPDEHVHKRNGQPRPCERPAKIPRAASPDVSDEVPPPNVPVAAKPGKPQKEKAKRTKKNTDETAEENKRRRQSQGPDLVEDDGEVAMTAEDAELLQKFQLLTHDFDDMDPQAKDDASFRQWLKDSQSFQFFFFIFGLVCKSTLEVVVRLHCVRTAWPQWGMSRIRSQPRSSLSRGGRAAPRKLPVGSSRRSQLHSVRRVTS